MPSKDSWGGPAACEPPFVDALRSLGHQITTIDYVFGDKDRPTPFHQRVSRVLRTAFRLRRTAADDDFDIIHLNSAFDLKTVLRDSVTLFFLKRGKAKVFVKLHGSTADEMIGANIFIRFLIGIIRKRVDGFGYLSAAERDAFGELGFDTENFYRVRNTFVLAKEALNEQRQQKDAADIFELIFVSRFVAAKGLVETIEACNELRSRGVRFRLTCVGDGESLQAAKDAVGRLAMGRVVTFTGYIPEAEVTAKLLNADIFVFPTSHAEGFPIVLFKAVSLGLPIVTTKIRAAADYLSEPENCLFCEKKPESIADRIQQLIENKALREEMSAANIDYGKTLTPDVIAKEFVEIYETILKA